MDLFRLNTVFKLLQNKQVTFRVLLIRIYEQCRKWTRFLSYPPNAKMYIQQIREGKHQVETKLNNLDSSSMQVPDYYAFICQQICAHKMDILGSGPVDINLKTENQENIFNGLIPDPYISMALDCLKEIQTTNPTYQLIDWQKDFKSGFRWDAKHSYSLQKKLSAGKHGVDLKVPRELAKMHHLLALSVMAQTDSSIRGKFLIEFKNQVLDFIANNPLGFGINWMSSMDVAIRAVNLLIAYDLFKKVDEQNILDQSFDTCFSNSIYLHGLHISKNFEYNASLTGNHYLANVAGLLIIASYLKPTTETIEWLSLSIQELLIEVDKQFSEEGSHYEGSTYYHKLCMEMVLWGVVFLLGLEPEKISLLKEQNLSYQNRYPLFMRKEKQKYSIQNGQIKFPNEFLRKLYLGICFIDGIKKEDYRIPQIGDTDSGKFIPLSFIGTLISSKEAIEKYENLTQEKLSGEKQYFDEDVLKTDPVMSLATSVFSDSPWWKDRLLTSSEFLIANQLAANKKITYSPSATDSLTDKILLSDEKNRQLSDKTFPYEQTTVLYEVDSDTSDIGNLSMISYSQFGLYILRSEKVYWLIRVSPKFTSHYTKGHFHNDLLSFELNVNGKDLYLDPGTYLYTSFPDERNRFRSTNAHNTMVVDGIEQNDWFYRGNIFYLSDLARCELAEAGDTFLAFSLQYKNIIQKRIFQWSNSTLQVKDFSTHPFRVHLNRKLYSNGYGRKITPDFLKNMLYTEPGR